MSEYGHFHATSAGVHIDMWGAGPLMIEYLGKTFRFEDSDRFGPVRLKKDGDSANNPFFAEKSPFWYAWGKWVDQGRRVDEDGMSCIWCHDEVAA
ncbi:hypothetical protein ASF69_04565 [Rhizobium sp. Leaf311]|uniref:hypothetical protein n=1 Tax=Rhizobium sp. Leaf311 TaxID=1736332 RepID=UPI00071264E3|nr:hypothetical protein [Rhizobium sp. Leaf311]KQQ46505.1 hypothetical protein ASF69_04565 [Rhizobium sp. Leaf311]